MTKTVDAHVNRVRTTVRRIGLVTLVALVALATDMPVRARATVPPLPPSMTYIMPLTRLGIDINTVADLRNRLAPNGEGQLVRLGFTSYINIVMTDWNVDTSNPDAVRAALAGTFASIDAAVQRGVDNNIPIGMFFVTAIRANYDPVQTASEHEDRRNMQWYTDNALAPGWWTHTQYARKQRRVQEAYIREVGKYVARQMAAYPDVVVAAIGDGEVELSSERFRDIAQPEPPSWADYSPFTVAEFRDWLRGEGLYAAGQPLAGQGYVNRARYQGDASPDVDTNGDGHTLNGDFGRTFSSWDLRYANWGLADNPNADPNAIPASRYMVPGWGPTDAGAQFFDAPRVRQNGIAWWDAWTLFRQEMIHRSNRDFAKWMTTSADEVSGASVPAERFYSGQIPTDYLFYNPDVVPGAYPGPNDQGVRLLTSASPWWTADVSPYGSIGITSYNVRESDGGYKKTLPWVAPHIAARNKRWGIIEWNPSDPWTTDPTPYRQEMAVVEQYRPHLLVPFIWGDTGPWRVENTGFELALREMIGRIKDPGPARVQMAIDAPAANAGVSQPFQIVGWAIDQGTVNGPGWTTGIDAVHVYAHPYTAQAADATPIFLGAASYGAQRTDISNAYGAQFGPSGFTLNVTGLAPGRYELVAHAHSTVTGAFSGVQRVIVGVDMPRLTPDTSALRYGMVMNGNAPAPQTVTLNQTGTGTLNWTAATDRSWLQVVPASGTGPGLLSVRVVAGDIGLLTPGTYTGRVTVTAPDAAGPVTVDVTVVVSAPAATVPPFGQVDTPEQNAAGVVGAIGVTGWALDDVGVAGVKIYRNCLPFDGAGSCQVLHGASTVFIGDAAFLDGARPDVEAAFPTYPQSRRAGWGYLMLTSMLPDVTNSLGYGGQGPLTIYAIATDAEGKTTLLGRSQVDHTPTSITMANGTISKPFGAIDTPTQGETVSGILANFGWVLTRDTNDTVDPDDIFIPTDGSTIGVFLDGVKVGQVTYNQCRGHVGPAVPAGSYCDDDVANIFGNPTPQPTFTGRELNPTVYRNLDAGRAAIGSYAIDTTVLANGLHTIAWGVTDSGGRVEGIGSRFFHVFNGVGGGPVGDPANPALDPVMTGGRLTVVGAGFSRPLRARVGFDVDAPFEVVPADADRVHQIRLEELGRLELQVGEANAGYLMANGTPRELPAGSHLDTAAGVFTWAPGAGFFGTYRLAFEGGRVRSPGSSDPGNVWSPAGSQVLVDVTVGPAAKAAPGEGEIRMHVDMPATGETISGEFRVAGWALDPWAAFGSGIGAVHVWAEDVFLGVAELGGTRPDVAAAFGSQFGQAGFGLTTRALAPGTHDVTVYVWNRRTGRWEDARTVRVTVR